MAYVTFDKNEPMLNASILPLTLYFSLELDSLDFLSH